ncbi:MAG: LysR substrate-binding domain-containing protein [Porticoccaceae bacterium]|nr:LysR substrate-binding domain-containing protein [Porticoccaceae bacterium]
MAAITFELLEILDAIDRRGSFAAAATELNRVPSALSYSIQKFEEALGLSLFVRQGRKSVFTPAGRLLLEQGRHLLNAAGVLSDDVRTLATGWEPRLKIAIDSLVPADAVMAVLGDFLGEHPGVEIDVCEEVLGGAWESLIEDRVQLVIGAPEPKPQGYGLRCELLGQVERVFAVSPDHPLAKSAKILDAEQISSHRIVIVHDSSRSTVPRATRLLNEDKHFYVQTIGQKIAAQKAGIGAGFLPRRQVESDLANGSLVELEVRGVNLQDPLYLAWKTSNKGQGLKMLASMLLAAKIPL